MQEGRICHVVTKTMLVVQRGLPQSCGRGGGEQHEGEWECPSRVPAGTTGVSATSGIREIVGMLG